MRDIAVVVPFYQRTPGVLSRSLASIAAQESVDLGRVSVHVIDDCSPIPVASELSSLGSAVEVRLAELKTNSGPGSARNAGLDALGEEVAYVAFLDSDDVWMPDHLAVALRTLQAGGTFFFANLFQLRANVPAFERAGRIHPSEHAHLFGDCYRYQGSMLDQIYSGNVIGTPTVVYQFERHSRLRFDPRYRRAGEDYLMWSEFATDGAVFVFRSTPSVRCCEGVNVYSGVQWGSREFLERTDDEIAYLRHAMKNFSLSPSVRQSVTSRISKLRTEYRRTFLRLLVTSPHRFIRPPS